MAIDFHAHKNRYTYASRDADAGWTRAIEALVDPRGTRVADIGCGGGIYTRAWHALGAEQVTGVDFSAEMVAASQERATGLQNVRFVQGSAEKTGLPSASFDVVFQRALIHHLPSYDACFAEARRLLVPGGLLIVQDRTLEDIDLPGSREHLRGYFFECFPRLMSVEAGRRPSQVAVSSAMKASGFTDIQSCSLWETRRTYEHFESLADDLTVRTGRSILHELNDEELKSLVDYMRAQLPSQGPIQEKDRWTLWAAR